MDEQNKPRSDRKFDDENVIDVEDNLSQYDEELSESEALDEEYIPAPPKRRNGLVAGVVLASLAVVASGPAPRYPPMPFPFVPWPLSSLWPAPPAFFNPPFMPA